MRWLAAGVWLGAGLAFAQPTPDCLSEDVRYALRLRNVAPLVPEVGSNRIGTGSFALSLAPDDDQIHAIVQLCERPDAATIQMLAQLTADPSAPVDANNPAVVLLAPLSEFAYESRLSKSFAQSLLDQGSMQAFGPAASKIRWIGGIPLATKQSPQLFRAEDLADHPPWAILPNGRVKLLVRFARGVPHDRVVTILDRHGAAGNRFADDVWAVEIRHNRIPRLLAENSVASAQHGPQGFLPLNTRARKATAVDVVQEFEVLLLGAQTTAAYSGLTGAGITVAVVDLGLDKDHQDFNDAQGNSRILNVPAKKHLHGTHIAGTIAGSGLRSESSAYHPALAYEHRGMAPRANLIAIDASQRGGDQQTYYDAFVTWNAQSGNHSYLQTCIGYDSVAYAVDRAVRGELVYTSSDPPLEAPVPAATAVWAAGNEGSFPAYCVNFGEDGTPYQRNTYFSLLSEAKNPIVVGGIDSRFTQILFDRSSLGPTLDGRIKPDLVAPATHFQHQIVSTSTEDVDFSPNAKNNDYVGNTGTSMAAGVVSGIVALLLEQWSLTFGNPDPCEQDDCPPPHWPRPSTVKALLIQGADDLSGGSMPWPVKNEVGSVDFFVGPDFASGWGRINASASTALLASKEPFPKFVEGHFDLGDAEHKYFLRVPQSAPAVKVTLAWDDAPGSDHGNFSRKLVNNLDLRLVDPTVSEHLPWVLMPLCPADDKHGNYDLHVNSDPVCSANAPLADCPATVTSPYDRPCTTRVTAATKGDDDYNNVEQVAAVGSLGLWTIRVVPDLLVTTQSYSVAADFPIIPSADMQPEED